MNILRNENNRNWSVQRFRNWHVEEKIFFKAVMVNKLLLVSSRFVCATVIQVNNRSRYAAAVFTSLYLRNRKYYIAICEWWIDHQDVDGKHVDKLLFDQWPSTTTYWVSLSLGLQRWGKIFSELLLFTWFLQ